MRIQALPVAALLLSVYGQAISQIANGLSFDGADTVRLLWGLDSGSSSSYDFYLCAGDESKDSYDSLSHVIKNGVYTAGDMVSFKVDQDIGGNDPNAYFLKIVLSGSQEYWSGFTSHFTLTNMTGSFSTKVADAIKTMQPNPAIAIPWPPVQDDDHLLEAAEVASAFNISSLTTTSTGTVLQFQTPAAHPESEHSELRKRQFAGAGAIGAAGVVGAVGADVEAAPVAAIDYHTVPYGEQTGATKYAPMPKKAGTTIATRSATPQYPPFPFSIATTYLGAPTVQYTDMAYATWTAKSIENTASPAPMPTLDKRMQKWLDRWQD